MDLTKHPPPVTWLHFSCTGVISISRHTAQVKFAAIPVDENFGVTYCTWGGLYFGTVDATLSVCTNNVIRVLSSISKYLPLDFDGLPPLS